LEESEKKERERKFIIFFSGAAVVSSPSKQMLLVCSLSEKWVEMIKLRQKKTKTSHLLACLCNYLRRKNTPQTTNVSPAALAKETQRLFAS